MKLGMLRQKMLRSRTDIMKTFLITVAIGGLLTLCGFLSFSTHLGIQRTQVQSCTADCSSHGSAAPFGSGKISNDDEEKEPIPPPTHWYFTPINLEATYLAPVLSLLLAGIIAHLFRRQLLSTQLRF